VRLKILLAFSLIAITSCQKFPEGNICLVDAARSRLLCYDMVRDLDANGRVKDEAQAKRVPVSLESLDKGTYFDPESWSNVKTWLRTSKDQCQSR
jgi:hypothetical protein